MYRNPWLSGVFNDFFDTDNMPKANATAPAINVLETENDYMVELAAPGMCRENFDVNINADGDLTIKMDKKMEPRDHQARYLRREFSYTKFEQTLILPDDVDKQKIEAKVADGVLTVTLPKMQNDKQKTARQIAIG